MKTFIDVVKRSAARRRLLWSAATVAVLAGSSVAGIAASGASATGNAPPSAATGVGTATAVPQVDAQALSVLSRPRTEADAVPAGETPTFSAASGANVGLSRKIETPSGNAWLVPGTSSLCLVDGGGAACVPAASAAEGDLAQEGGVGNKGPIKLSEVESAPKEVSGVVPNGVETVTVHLVSGSTSTLAVHENVYMGTVEGAVSTVTFRERVLRELRSNACRVAASLGVSTIYLAAALHEAGGDSLITTEIDSLKANALATRSYRLGLRDGRG